MNDKTTLPVKAWKAKYAKPTAERNTLNQRYLALKEEVAEAETVKPCVEQVIPPTEQRKEKAKTQDISL